MSNLNKVLPYGRQWIDDNDLIAVNKSLKSDWLTQGPLVRDFESNLAQYCGAKYAVACCNGTAALHLACMSADLKQGDEVITSAITFLASANCALYVGAKPVFSDIDYQTGLITPDTLQSSISNRTCAIIPVHLGGQSCDMETISSRVDRSKVVIIEDACHALGGEYRDNKVGGCRFSDMTIFSFHPVKHITTGEGGAIITNRLDLYEKMMILRSHGMTKDPQYLEKQEGPWYYEMHWLGFNYRITDFQCALGISQLMKLDQFIERRREIAKKYRDAFKNLPYVKLLSDQSDVKNAYHLFIILIDYQTLGKSRKQVVEELRQYGVTTQVHYYPVPLQPYYKKKFGFKTGDFPQAENYYKQALSIPMYASMTDEDTEHVIQSLTKVLAQ